MSKTSIATSSGSKRGAAARRVSGGKTKAPQEGAAPTIEDPKPAGARFEARVTKQDRMLTLLSRSEGASIEEMIRATSWQQHSVRGFLAGTVKKKLGFLVSSFKTEGDVRRYHIDKPRGR
jgi:hypothetical protein